MANTIDVIEKLIQLALKNPEPAEAAAAALKAVALIDKYQIPIGANVTIVRDVADEWKPPTPEENAIIEDMLKGKHRSDPEAGKAYTGQHHEGKTEGLINQDNSPMTGKDAFRQRLIDAWRALREERVRFQGEVYRYELETHRTFWGDGRPWR